MKTEITLGAKDRSQIVGALRTLAATWQAAIVHARSCPGGLPVLFEEVARDHEVQSCEMLTLADSLEAAEYIAVGLGGEGRQ